MDIIWESTSGFWWVRCRGGFVFDCPWFQTDPQPFWYWTLLQTPSNTDRCDPRGAYSGTILWNLSTGEPTPEDYMTATVTIT